MNPQALSAVASESVEQKDDSRDRIDTPCLRYL